MITNFDYLKNEEKFKAFADVTPVRKTSLRH